MSDGKYAKFNRSAGLLMSVSSFPSPFGIGCFTADVDMFVDMAVDMGFHWWQLLPITTIGLGNSPYSGISTYAGNYLYVSPIELFKKGLITVDELENAKYKGEPYLVDYEFAKDNMTRVLNLAYERITPEYRKGMNAFYEEEKDWLDDYALYMTSVKHFGAEWYKWDSPLANREPSRLDEVRREFARDIDFYVFEQYEFFSEWYEVKRRANAHGVKIIGDLPFYVATDSADVWANKEFFLLDEKNVPTAIAGVPPDAFASDGQVWGNCLYDFDKMEKDGFSWWRKRVKHCFKMYDALRLDHFRAFHTYFAIPYGDTTAKNGAWREGPQDKLLDLIREDNPSALFIAEDLGQIDNACRKYIDSTGIPTMRVFQFGFDGTPGVHLPYNYQSSNVAYTGTHDNNTTLGWLYELNEGARNYALKYCGFEGAGWASGGPSCASTKAIIKTVVASSAVLAIFPVQDLLGYGGDTRMNIPGVAEGNWRYRLPFELMLTVDRDFFLDVNNTYGRNNPVLVV